MLTSEESWWDYAFLMEDFATILLHNAMMLRKHGHTTDAGKMADQMEECAWLMLDVDADNQEAADKFTEILRKNIRYWWD